MFESLTMFQVEKLIQNFRFKMMLASSSCFTFTQFPTITPMKAGKKTKRNPL